MVKILVADENTERAIGYCKCFANDERYRIEYTTNGKDTINKCIYTDPHIIIINSHFSDIEYDDILYRLSCSFSDKRKCNIIVTFNNEKQHLQLCHVSKVYKVVPSSIKSENILKLINAIFEENNYVEIETVDIQILLLQIGLHLSSLGGKYLTEIIEECFYFPNKLNDVNFMFDFITKKYNKDSAAIRSAIRTTLKPINNNKKLYKDIEFWKLFDTKDHITPKQFIEDFVIYLYMQQKKKK